MPGFGPPLQLAGTIDGIAVATDVRACETCGAFVVYPSIHADWHRQLRAGVATGVLTEPRFPLPATVDRFGTNAGHGHVWPRPDGLKAKCGGPALCGECAADLAQVQGPPAAAAGVHSYEQSDPHVDGCDHCGDLRRHHP